MNACNQYTLAQLTDRYMMLRGIDSKKRFGAWLTVAEDVHRDLFRNTLWNIKSVWKPVQSDGTGWYINIPSDCTRLLNASMEDDCKHIEPLYYNNRINVVKKPTTKKCGCNALNCDCAGACEAMNSLSMTTKLLFTISGVDYYEKTWLQYCPNGDILEWKEVPTKKYNSMQGDAGDFNDDYNDDYSTEALPFSDYTIITETFQKKICSLETLPCGCPADSDANTEVINNFCGCYINWTCGMKKKCCDDFLGEINPHFRPGEVKISQCGTKLYYFPTKNARLKQPVPDWLLLNYQTNGKVVGQETLVPDYAWNCMWAGMDHYGKRFNDRYSRVEKMNMGYVYEDEKNRLILYLNPLSLYFLRDVQDADIKW